MCLFEVGYKLCNQCGCQHLSTCGCSVKKKKTQFLLLQVGSHLVSHHTFNSVLVPTHATHSENQNCTVVHPALSNWAGTPSSPLQGTGMVFMLMDRAISLRIQTTEQRQSILARRIRKINMFFFFITGSFFFIRISCFIF